MANHIIRISAEKTPIQIKPIASSIQPDDIQVAIKITNHRRITVTPFPYFAYLKVFREWMAPLTGRMQIKASNRNVQMDPLIGNPIRTGSVKGFGAYFREECPQVNSLTYKCQCTEYD